MAKKNTPVDPLVAALMPESDKKMGAIDACLYSEVVEPLDVDAIALSVDRRYGKTLFEMGREVHRNLHRGDLVEQRVLQMLLIPVCNHPALLALRPVAD